MTAPTDPRCDRCDWPLRATIEEGCTEENCSQRPLPPIRKHALSLSADTIRARLEAGEFMASVRAEILFLLDELARAMDSLNERREKFGEQARRAEKAEAEVAALTAQLVDAKAGAQ